MIPKTAIGQTAVPAEAIARADPDGNMTAPYLAAIAAGWPAFDAALTQAHVPQEGHIYKGANHGFHNDTTPRYDEAAAKEAWGRTLDWFNKYLRT